MKNDVLIAWAAIGFTVFATSSMAFEPAVIDVQVVSHSKFGRNASGVVTVTIRNLAKVPVYLPKFRDPTEDLNGRLLGDILVVVGKSGHRAGFIGMFNDFRTSDPNYFYTRIDPGESKSRDVDVAVDYDLTADEEFTVQYTQPFTTVVKTNAAGELVSGGREQPSETAEIWVGKATNSR